jgi:hypothetical protein
LELQKELNRRITQIVLNRGIDKLTWGMGGWGYFIEWSEISK